MICFYSKFCSYVMLLRCYVLMLCYVISCFYIMFVFHVLSLYVSIMYGLFLCNVIFPCYVASMCLFLCYDMSCFYIVMFISNIVSMFILQVRLDVMLCFFVMHLPRFFICYAILCHVAISGQVYMACCFYANRMLWYVSMSCLYVMLLLCYIPMLRFVML